jgi:hypothetical protein
MFGGAWPFISGKLLKAPKLCCDCAYITGWLCWPWDEEKEDCWACCRPSKDEWPWGVCILSAGVELAEVCERVMLGRT